MENKVQVMDDKQAEVVDEKKPYQTPTLTKLGSVKQLTQGVPYMPGPDDGGISW